MSMTADQIKAKAIVVLRAVVRFLWIFVSNVYSIPAHLLLMWVLMPMKAYAPELYYFIDGVSFRWLQCLVAHWMYSAGYKVAECGDDLTELEDEGALVMCNHQSTADVPSLMYALQFHHRVIDKMMWIMDIMFKHTNFGWISQMRGDFFIQQKHRLCLQTVGEVGAVAESIRGSSAENDSKWGKETRALQGPLLAKHLNKYYVPRKREWIVVFPEGGFLYKQKKSSQAYGRKQGLPHLEHCLLPRVGAVHTIMKTLAPDSKDVNPLDQKKPLKWIIDVTIAYPKGVPLNLQTIVSGHRSAMVTTMYYRKYPIDQVPTEQGELFAWMCERYVEKDKLLDEFYKTGKFPGIDTASHKILELNAERRFGLHLFYIFLSYCQLWVVWYVVSTLWSLVCCVF